MVAPSKMDLIGEDVFDLIEFVSDFFKKCFCQFDAFHLTHFSTFVFDPDEARVASFFDDLHHSPRNFTLFVERATIAFLGNLFNSPKYAVTHWSQRLVIMLII